MRYMNSKANLELDSQPSLSLHSNKQPAFTNASDMTRQHSLPFQIMRLAKTNSTYPFPPQLANQREEKSRHKILYCTEADTDNTPASTNSKT